VIDNICEIAIAMNSDQPWAEGEWALHNPVKIITDEDMAAYKEEMRLNPPGGSDVVVCPIGDESVQGYATDQEPVQGGVKDILKVVRMLEGAGVPCCMVAEPALIYYGTGRVKTVCKQSFDSKAHTQMSDRLLN
jgi:hypothetical protein